MFQESKAKNVSKEMNHDTIKGIHKPENGKLFKVNIDELKQQMKWISERR